MRAFLFGLLTLSAMSNLQTQTPPQPYQTVFTINSIAKAFTGVAIMQLLEAGQLDIAAPASRYLDGLPAAWKAVTLQHLLTHTSGLPDYTDDIGKVVTNEGDDTSWAKVQSLPMEVAPGEQFRYNQTNYLLLGRIIDTLSGQPFAQFITERQLRLVGMPLTVFADSHDVVPHSARLHLFPSWCWGVALHGDARQRVRGSSTVPANVIGDE
jgi:CubicO group peptidase (beta-lactamase class C family)